MQTLVKINLSNQIKEIVLSSGFDLVGISEAKILEDSHFLKDWLEKGFHGTMKYMEDSKRRSDVREINSKFKSVISCAINYNNLTKDSNSYKALEDNKGWISRYATGDDYHSILGKKLKLVALKIQELFDEQIVVKSYVDTGPILERAHASMGGVGWIGKNSCLINKEIGSWIFVSDILIDKSLVYDSNVKDFCGTCTKCIDACPTNAIVSEKVVDSKKCISYLTIENKKYVEDRMARKFLNNVYGCDICQEVCPWNSKAKIVESSIFNNRDELISPDISILLNKIETEWETLKIKSPIKRAKKDGLIRNILIVMGNSRDSKYIPILEKYAKSHNEIHIRTAEDSIKRLSI